MEQRLDLPGRLTGQFAGLTGARRAVNRPAEPNHLLVSLRRFSSSRLLLAVRHAASPNSPQETHLNAACNSCGETRKEQALSLWNAMQANRDSGDMAGYARARTALYEMYEKLAFSYARRFLSDDMCQECRLAVLETIDRWDPDRGDFSTLLYYKVHSRLREHLRNKEMIRRPDSVFDKHYQALNSGTESSETAPLQILSTEVRNHAGSYDWADHSSSLLDWWAAAEDNDFENFDLTFAIETALDYLEPAKREAVSRHFGFDGHEPSSYRDLAKISGCSYQSVKNHVDLALPLLAAVLDGIR